ncbi:hypothetical protein SNEBB_000089 [Seison nebaliae]|nr:hypothetical protein SNEBB_000089 [Seison nebaliae]
MRFLMQKCFDKQLFRSLPSIWKLPSIAQFIHNDSHLLMRDITSGQPRTIKEFYKFFPEATNFDNVENFESLHQFALDNPKEFWGSLAKSRLHFFKDFDEVMEGSLKNGDLKWFLNGKLNVSFNCLDRHCIDDPNRVALIWEKDEPGQQVSITYGELLSMTCRIGNLLKNENIKKGDVITIYMPVSPIAIATMLACTRIGAIHSVVFAGFSSQALADRINDCNSKLIITSNFGVRGGKKIPLQQTVDMALDKTKNIQKVFYMKRLNEELEGLNHVDKFYNLEENMVKFDDECPPEEMDSEDPLFTLYTSGSTGKPKGLLHTNAGYLLYSSVTHQSVFNYQPGDVFACVADIGWITGHSYVVYGPLSNGATTVLFESIPTYPDPGRYWEMVERLKINQLYLAPTAVRILLKHGDEYVTKYNRNSLRIIGSVGEPINEDAWLWLYNIVGNDDNNLVITDTWWQTETGGIVMTPTPRDLNQNILPGRPMRPFLGQEITIMDPINKTEIVERERGAALCLKRPWPGIARTIIGDHKKYIETYFKDFPGYYFSGDGVYRHSDDSLQISGRMDDVVNISGHRLGTAEVENVINEHEYVAESAIIGYPHELKGEAIYAFITLKSHVNIKEITGGNYDMEKQKEQFLSEVKQLIRKEIASYAIPDKILITNDLPRTRSGKIMRRILKKIAEDKIEELGDTSTLFLPSVVDDIIKVHQAVTKK